MINFKNAAVFSVVFTFLFLSPYVFANAEPQALVQSVASKTIERITKDKTLIKKDPTHINTLINELVIPHFDFNRMSRWVLGKYWRKTDKAQKSAFIDQFKNLLIRTYATSLSEYVDQEIKYLPFRGDLAKGDVTVRSEIEQPGGFPIPINYRLHNKTGEWKVYDITIDDISLIANYRSSFAKHIRKSGVDDLIATLADKSK